MASRFLRIILRKIRIEPVPQPVLGIGTLFGAILRIHRSSVIPFPERTVSPY